jgi:putative nucleotidyltransferase with HDIG domain
MSGLLEHPLRSRVGRRIALVVLVSAIVPLAAIGGVLFTRARDQLEVQARARLHDQTKTVALNGMERLSLLEERLRWLAGNQRVRSSGAVELPALLGSFNGLDSLAMALAQDAAPRLVRGDTAPPAVGPVALEVLREGGALLVPGTDGRGYWMFAAVESADGGFAAARIPPAAVFGFGEGSTLSPNLVLCVFDDGHRMVACSDGGLVAEAAGIAALPTHGAAEVVVDGVAYRARTWALSLERGYRAGTWTVALMEPREESLATLDRFAREVLLLSALSLIVVVLAVLAAIRRSLSPLSRLEAAAARVARHDFDVEVLIATRDEFEDLARGFNSMVGELRQRFEALEAFSVGTATSLARTIDAKSPWTAGHSERVTQMALEIAAAMKLPDRDIEVLSLGGLLHDIGKLATPQHILEKAGPLTVDERYIIERHPADGARILEPIPKFAAILPIVLQHHERFDGGGYPAHLAGDQIDRLARVLAVADVFDALRSNRPYREGWPLDRAIAYVQAASGTHFDPVVVEAFTRVIQREVVGEGTVVDRAS